MDAPVSSLYKTEITGLRPLLAEAVEKGLSRTSSSPAQVFFRADDIGVPSRSFSQMIEVFKAYNTPLCLAFVPSWLTSTRWQTMRRSMDGASLFCCHQHGWKHTNHELHEKKQEFGDSRTEEEINHDLKRGRDRLAEIIGDNFFPFFTPPWNRCGDKTLNCLRRLNFKGISRSSKASPSASPRGPPPRSRSRSSPRSARRTPPSTPRAPRWGRSFAWDRPRDGGSIACRPSTCPRSGWCPPPGPTPWPAS